MSKFLNTSGSHNKVKLENSYSKDPQDVQIRRLLSDQKKMSDGMDLTKWSLSARKGLAAAGSASLQKDMGANQEPWKYEAPKLSMVAASPVLARHFTENPDSNVYMFEAHNSKKAIETITYWLREPMLRVDHLESFQLKKITPDMKIQDLKDAFVLRKLALELEMDQYVDIASAYEATLTYPNSQKNTEPVYRVPSTAEGREIIHYQIVNPETGRDAIVDVLAHHLVVLDKKEKLNGTWRRFLADRRSLALVQAMELAKDRFDKNTRKEREDRKKKEEQVKASQKGKGKKTEAQVPSPKKPTNMFAALIDDWE